MIGASFIPVVGETMDAAVIADPGSHWWEKGLATLSLGLSYITAGAAPNFGAVARGGKKALGAVDKVADAGKAGKIAEKVAEDAGKVGKAALSPSAKTRLAKEVGGIPRSAQPVAQGTYGKGTRWWEYKDSNGKIKIVVQHPDGTVHVGTPKPQSLHRTGEGPPKYYPQPGSGHVGE